MKSILWYTSRSRLCLKVSIIIVRCWQARCFINLLHSRPPTLPYFKTNHLPFFGFLCSQILIYCWQCLVYLWPGDDPPFIGATDMANAHAFLEGIYRNLCVVNITLNWSLGNGGDLRWFPLRRLLRKEIHAPFYEDLVHLLKVSFLTAYQKCSRCLW